MTRDEHSRLVELVSTLRTAGADLVLGLLRLLQETDGEVRQLRNETDQLRVEVVELRKLVERRPHG